MFENENAQVVLKRMLSRVSEGMDKRQGSIIYDTLMPLAHEIAFLYEAMDYVIVQSMPSTQDRDNLILFADTFNIKPNEATYAEVEAELITNPPTYIVENGTRFNGGNVNYSVISHKEGTRYYLRCETAGSVGNNYYGLIQPIFNVPQLTSARIIDTAIPGADVEDTESFRERVRENFNQKAFGGNYADYYSKIKLIQGVGGCKIIGTPQRNKTLVDVYIIDSEFKKPSEETIEFVQKELHPKLKEETQEALETSGVGIAPIGHDVTVKGVRERKINIKTNLSFAADYNWGRVESSVREALNTFFLQWAQEWEESDSLIIRVSGIETSIIGIEGILDIWETTIDDGLIEATDRNIELEFDEIPVLGEITGDFING